MVFVTTITEEKRLAALVATIDADVAVAPRGAYHRTPTGKIELNPSFEGNKRKRERERECVCVCVLKKDIKRVEQDKKSSNRVNVL